MDKFSNVNKNLHNGKIISKRSTSQPLYQSSPIEEELELFNTFLFNLRGNDDSTSDELFIHYRDKMQIKEILDVANDVLGTFTANEILQLRKTMNQFVHMQNPLGHITARNQNEIRAMQLAMEELGKVIHVLAESQPQ
jgi:hypothetical protein